MEVIRPLEDRRELTLRRISEPERPLTAFLDRLGLTVPTRLRAPFGLL